MQFKDLKKTYQSHQPSSSWKEQTKEGLLAVMEEKFGLVQKPSFSFKPVFITIMVLLIVGISFSFVKAKEAIPGQPLYALKRFSEKTHLFFTPPEQRPVLRAEILANRASEAKTLTENSQDPSSLEELNRDFQKELFALKEDLKEKIDKKEEPTQPGLALKPILEENQENHGDANFFQPTEQKEEASPVPEEMFAPLEDDVFAFYISPDLSNILEETKDLISANNFEAALEKTEEIEEKITGEEKETILQPETSLEKTEETEEEKEITPQEEISPNNPQPINPLLDEKEVLGEDKPETIPSPEPDSSEPDFQGNMFQDEGDLENFKN